MTGHRGAGGKYSDPMLDGDSIQALLSDGAFPPRAALEAAAAACAALERQAAVPGGRPLTAASVHLSASGSATLRDVDETDALAIGSLLAHVLLGRRRQDGDIDALIEAIDAALQGPEVDRGWRRKLIALVRACHSPDPDSRPPLHRVHRRCVDLVVDAPGVPLAVFLKKRESQRASWMDLPSATEPAPVVADIPQIHPTATHEPAPAQATTEPPARPAPASRPRSSQPPLVTEAPRQSLGLIAVAVGLAILTAGGLTAWRMRGASGTGDLSPVPPPSEYRSPTVVGSVRSPGEDGYRLFLSSEPEGAVVSVDGAPLGSTPLEAAPLDRGVHHIRFEADGDTFEQAVMIDRDARCVWTPGAEAADAWACGEPGITQ